jgi:hypothetical protein
MFLQKPDRLITFNPIIAEEGFRGYKRFQGMMRFVHT